MAEKMVRVSAIANSVSIQNRTYVEFRPGTHIKEALEEVFDLALKKRSLVEGCFNGFRISIDGRGSRTPAEHEAGLRHL